MKKTIFILVQFMFTFITYSQQLNQQQVITKQDYRERSKSNKTAGFIMLGAGAALTTGGFISLGTTNWLDGDVTPFVLITSGTVAILGSIPLFVISGIQAKKASAVSGVFKMENLPKESYGVIKNKSIPAVSVILNF